MHSNLGVGVRMTNFWGVLGSGASRTRSVMVEPRSIYGVVTTVGSLRSGDVADPDLTNNRVTSETTVRKP